MQTAIGFHPLDAAGKQSATPYGVKESPSKKADAFIRHFRRCTTLQRDRRS